MQTVYVDRRDAELALERGALVVRVPGARPKSLPLGRVERLVLRTGVHLSTSLLAELWRREVPVLVLARHGREATARFLGASRHELGLRLLQYELVRDPAHRLTFARELVAAKLRAQARLLRRLAEGGRGNGLRLREGADRIEALVPRAAGAAALDALLGLEGTASAAHFEAYATLFPASLGFRGRNRRPPRDPVNACLSLAYTLLHFEAARTAHLHGLDPTLGALHAPAAGRDSLACDLVEPLRPHIDEWVAELFAHRTLRGRDFTRQGEAVLLGRVARGRFYEAWEERAPALRRLLARMVRRFVRDLRARVPPVVVPESGEADS